jgi:hypothetical protein
VEVVFYYLATEDTASRYGKKIRKQAQSRDTRDVAGLRDPAKTGGSLDEVRCHRKDIVEVLRGCFGEHQLAAAYRLQIKA